MTHPPERVRLHLRAVVCGLLLAPALLPLAAIAQAPSASAGFLAVTSALTPGAVHGRLVYSDGAPFAAGDLTLTMSGAPALHTSTEADGTFLFLAVPPGPFTVEAVGDGVEPASLNGTLAPSANLELPPLLLRLSAIVTSVNAISPEQLAETQVRAEERQRLFGAIPNFFVSYDPRVVPLSARQKFRLSTRTLLDPTNLALVAVVAGGEQTIGMFPGFAPGPRGFGERFAASFGDGATQIMLTGAILPSVLHQDPRYFYQGTGSRRSRFANVLRQALEQKGDNGRWQFAWSNTLGDVGSALISTAYYPTTNPAAGRQWGTLTATNCGLALGSQAVANFLQEFFLGRLTTHTQP